MTVICSAWSNYGQVVLPDIGPPMSNVSSQHWSDAVAEIQPMSNYWYNMHLLWQMWCNILPSSIHLIFRNPWNLAFWNFFSYQIFITVHATASISIMIQIWYCPDSKVNIFSEVLQVTRFAKIIYQDEMPSSAYNALFVIATEFIWQD